MIFFETANLLGVPMSPAEPNTSCQATDIAICLQLAVRAMTLRRSQYMMINDGIHSYQLLTYYIRPEDIRVFSSVSGCEILGHSELRNLQRAGALLLMQDRVVRATEELLMAADSNSIRVATTESV
jgi:hypothetical protein